MIARRLRITGKVQGVWFRGWAVRTATSLGLTGWVRNRRDRSVEALAIGEPDALERFAAACHEGPSRAAVERVCIEEAQIEALAEFEQRETL